MKFLDNLSKRLNPQQKNIVAIVVPIIILVITISMASRVDGCCSYNAFDFKDTWFPWVICFIVIGYFEYKLFGNAENK